MTLGKPPDGVSRGLFNPITGMFKELNTRPVNVRWLAFQRKRPTSQQNSREFCYDTSWEIDDALGDFDMPADDIFQSSSG